MLLLIFLWVLPAFASEAPAPPSSSETPAPSQAGPTDSELHELEARALYQVGLQLVIQQAWDEADVVFQRILADYGDTAIAAQAEEQLASLEQLSKASGMNPAARARAELIIDQAILSAAFFGFLVPASTWQPSQPLGPVALGAAGLSLGIVGSVAASRHYEPTQGQVMALFTGQWMGTANGFTASSINPPRDFRGVYRSVTWGTVLGTAGGAAVGHFLHPTAGQVSMVNSAALWGLYLAGWSYAYWQPDHSSPNINRNLALRFTAFGDVAALGGALLAWKLPISRARMNLGNLGAIAGGLLGFGGALLFDFYSPYGLSDPAAFYGLIIVPMTATGGVAAILATRSLDQDRLTARWEGLEVHAAAGPNGVGVSGRF